MKYIVVACLLVAVAQCTRYHRDGQECIQDKNGNEHCYKKSEYPEDDDEDMPMFYDEESNTKSRQPLFIWDPVRVGLNNV